jgi:uncharacterized protein (TIGR03382 family)
MVPARAAVAVALPVVLAVVLDPVASPREAAACSLSPPGIHARTTYPADGATGVPTNTQPRFAYDATIEPSGTTALRLAGGEPVAWDAPLAPDTTYEIVSDVVVPCTTEQFQETECLGEEQVLATFTTGNQADETPPAFPGLAELTSSYFYDERESCDGPFAGVWINLSWQAAGDDGPADGIRYRIYAGGQLQGSVTGTSAIGIAFCDGLNTGEGLSAPDFWGVAGDYVVRAVDGAGNEESNDVTLSTVSCTPEPEPEPDPDPPSDGGCSASGRRSSASFALAVVLAPGFAWRRRRRRASP